MRLVPDPHKTRHKKMTGELIPSSSCNGVSSPYSGLLLRLEVWSQLPGWLGWGQPSLLFFILNVISAPHVPESWQCALVWIMSLCQCHHQSPGGCHTITLVLTDCITLHTVATHSCTPIPLISYQLRYPCQMRQEWLDVMVNSLNRL